MAVQWLRGKVVGLSQPRSSLNPKRVRVGFVVDRVIVGQSFSEFLDFPIPVIIVPVFQIDSPVINTLQS